MRRLIFIIGLLLVSFITQSQVRPTEASTFVTGAKPFYQKNLIVKDSVGIEGIMFLNKLNKLEFSNKKHL